MSTLVVQELQIWLNFAEMRDAEKVFILDALIVQADTFWQHCRGLRAAVLGSEEADGDY